MIDRDVSLRFWNERARRASDPRSVTLDRDSAASVAREVRLYQAWMFRQLQAVGARFEAVVDLGCGNGDWTVALARRAGRLTAVDFSPAFVDHCRRRVEASVDGAKVDFVCADAAAYELTGPCDVIVAGAVTQYLDDAEVEALLGRVRAALAPRDGVLYLRTTVAKNADRRETHTDEYQGIYRSQRWYRQAMARCGLRVERAALATDFVADELGSRILGPVAGPVLGTPLRAVRRIYRSRRPTDVLACVARVAADARPAG